LLDALAHRLEQRLVEEQFIIGVRCVQHLDQLDVAMVNRQRRRNSSSGVRRPLIRQPQPRQKVLDCAPAFGGPVEPGRVRGLHGADAKAVQAGCRSAAGRRGPSCPGRRSVRNHVANNTLVRRSVPASVGIPHRSSMCERARELPRYGDAAFRVRYHRRSDVT
jgi:hypothetical protein